MPIKTTKLIPIKGVLSIAQMSRVYYLTRQFFIVFILLGLIYSCKKQSTWPDPLKAGWQGKAVCEVIENNNNLRVLKCKFPPNVGHERHYHNPHFGYTLAGGKFRIEDTAGIREVEIPTGYSFSNERIEWHEVLNIGTTTAEFLIIEYK